MAEKVIAKVPTDSVIGKIELSKMGNAPDDKAGFFMNIFLKDDFVVQRINNIA